MISYGRQDISQEDIDAVTEVLVSDFLTQGPVVPKYEKLISQYCNSKYSVAANSATSALHIACLALGVKTGDIVWTSANTFVASSNAALYCGAKVDFVDIDHNTYNMSVESLIKKLEIAKAKENLPKVVIPVHLCGQSCDMSSIYDLSIKYNFSIIEDASHAIGGKYKDQPIGNCDYSDITVFSFHPVKIITTGEGGLATTNDRFLAEKMTLYRTHGITSDQDKMNIRPVDEIWNYQQIDLGYNYRMTDIAASLGISQLSRLDEFVKDRHRIAKRYDEAFKNLSIQTPFQNKDTYSSYHLYPIRIKREINKKSQIEITNTLYSKGFNVNLHYIPVYRHPYYEALGFEKHYCPQAELYFKEAISIPIFPKLKDSQQEEIIDIIINEIK